MSTTDLSIVNGEVRVRVVAPDGANFSFQSFTAILRVGSPAVVEYQGEMFNGELVLTDIEFAVPASRAGSYYQLVLISPDGTRYDVADGTLRLASYAEIVRVTMPIEVEEEPAVPGVTEHGALTGLEADDHPQYLTEDRGDALYWPLSTDLATQAELDAVVLSGGVTDHGALTGLDSDDHLQYLTEGRGDLLYWPLATDLATQAELDAVAGTIVTDHGDLAGLGADDHAIYHTDARGDARYWPLSTDLATQVELDAHKSSSDHDGRYYTETETDALLAAKAASVHTHTASQITDFATASDARIAAWVGAAPGALDTLDELAAALGDDPNFATTITTLIGTKQPLDADLTTIAGLTATTDNIMQAKAGAWASRTPAQVAADLPAASISGFDTQVRTSKIHQLATPTAATPTAGYGFTDLGALEWGATTDVSLNRSAAGTLQLTVPVTQAGATFLVKQNAGLAGDAKVWLQPAGSSNYAQISLGGLEQVKLRLNTNTGSRLFVECGSMLFESSAMIIQRAMAATTDQTHAARISTDTIDRFQTYADGKLAWGPGGSGAIDTYLSRNGIGELKTDGVFRADSNIVAQTGTAAKINIGDVGSGSPGIVFGSAAAENLARISTGVLRLTAAARFEIDDGTNGMARMVTGAAPGFTVLKNRADANVAIALYTSGAQTLFQMGQGGASAVDAGFEWGGANILKMLTGDKWQQAALPTVGDDLTNRTYVTSRGIPKRVIADRSAKFPGGLTAGVNHVGMGGLSGLVTVASSSRSFSPFYIDSTEIAVSGFTATMSLECQIAANTVAAGVTGTLGLYPVTAANGASGAIGYTVGTVVTGSTIASGTVAASAMLNLTPVSFAVPASGWYILGVNLSGTMAANSMWEVEAKLKASYA